jgi:hypothetical protein
MAVKRIFQAASKRGGSAGIGFKETARLPGLTKPGQTEILIRKRI